MSVIPVLFDDCAFAGMEPYLGEQHPPVPGVHNSGWTPSPGSSIADDPDKERYLHNYVQTIVGNFKSCKNIAAWDLYNEPGNNGRGAMCLPLLTKAFDWAREAAPEQPLTAGIWEFKEYDLSFAELSDVVSYHDYAALDESEKKIAIIKKHNRPLLCTECLHRPAGNKFESHLPLYKREGIGFYNWGFVNGKTQTHFSWNTMNGGPDDAPAVWQHDIFYPDGVPYDENEIKLLKYHVNIT